MEIDDLKYSVYPWTEHTIDVGGENGPEYLKVNLDELKIYNTNVDSSSLKFSSSSPVDIYIIPMGTNIESLTLANKLRDLGIKVDLEMNNKKLKK